jgi:hypothetical protein
MSELLSLDDAYGLAEKICEMSDRLTPIDTIMPGTIATTFITIDGITFKLSLTVATSEQADS